MADRTARYYVFEMQRRDRKQPARLVNAIDKGKAIPLPLEGAKRLARIGAQYGKHDRAVTTSPRAKDFKVIAQYEQRSGKNVTKQLYGSAHRAAS